MKLETQINIAANLRLLRASRGLSQKQVAESVGICRSMYTHYELGNRPQDAEVLFLIADFFNVDMSIFFETDRQNFIKRLSENTPAYESSDIKQLINIYSQYSSFHKGMLMERALWLLEKEKQASK